MDSSLFLTVTMDEKQCGTRETDEKDEKGMMVCQENMIDYYR